MNEKDEFLCSEAYKEIELNKDVVNKDIYRQTYHLMPPVGLLNDPNGFIYFKGAYHLFFQWMPFKTDHGAKFWGHYSSTDMINWNLEPIALAPSSWYDKDGCYSGSAIENNNNMVIFYTGNVKNDKGERESYQCMACSEDGINFIKQGVVIETPKGYTPHFRDPKVWHHNNKWYMVVGAQTIDEKGNIALYESYNLKDWDFKGNIIKNDDNFIDKMGYMWECPDMFTLDNYDILLFSPQGLKPEGLMFNNKYQSGYLIGKLDYNSYEFTGYEGFFEMDRGFEFYAPQTTLDHKGRRLLFGWMGVPEQDEKLHPTHNYKWIHNMTIPRELKLYNGKLYQIPVEELKELRKNERFEKLIISKDNNKIINLVSMASEIYINLDTLSSSSILNINLFNNYASINYNSSSNILTLQRENLSTKEIETRACYIKNLSSLRLYIDNSSLEFFVNDGEEVFTSRMFMSHDNSTIEISCNTNTCIEVNVWDL